MTGRRLGGTLLALSLTLALPSSLGTALAQTTVNPGALDKLAPPPDTSSPPTPQPPRKQLRTKSTGKSAAKPDPHAPSKATKPSPPAVPKAAPPAPVLPPPVVVPTRPTPPAVTAPPVKDAPGEPMPQKDGLRVTFGVGRSDLNPVSDAAVRALPHQAPGLSSTARYAVTAYAGGNADDPSTPRRLALSRALAIRSLLIAEGAESANITVRALGPPPADDSSPDRVDITVSTGQPPAAAASSMPSPTALVTSKPAPEGSGSASGKQGQGR